MVQRAFRHDTLWQTQAGLCPKRNKSRMKAAAGFHQPSLGVYLRGSFVLARIRELTGCTPRFLVFDTSRFARRWSGDHITGLLVGHFTGGKESTAVRGQETRAQWKRFLP